MITLSNLSPNEGAKKNRKRLGRGPGTGHGKTAGRGHKGAKSRSGYNSKPGFEGGQMPLQRRLPKRGFNNIFRKEYSLVTLTQLSSFDDGSVVDNDALVAAGIVKKDSLVKILANGELLKSITVKVDAASASAKSAIESAGGTVILN